jgi:hypothetical protein
LYKLEEPPYPPRDPAAGESNDRCDPLPDPPTDPFTGPEPRLDCGCDSRDELNRFHPPCVPADPRSDGSNEPRPRLLSAACPLANPPAERSVRAAPLKLCQPPCPEPPAPRLKLPCPLRKPLFPLPNEPAVRGEETNRCELGDPARIVDGAASRFEDRKLSRDGDTGIWPVIALDRRKSASLM